MVCTRRKFLLLLAAAFLAPWSRPAPAKDGDKDGDHDDGDHDDSGHDDDGGDDGGGDDGGGDDGDGDGDDGGGDDGGHDGGGKDNGGGKGKKRDDATWSQDKVLKERQLGRVIPLKTALRIVATRVRGRVIDVDLLARNGRAQYRVKVRRVDGVIETVRLDARTGRIIGLLGF